MLVQINDRVEVSGLGPSESPAWVRLSVMGGSFIVRRPPTLTVPCVADVATVRCRIEEFSRPGKDGRPGRVAAFVVEEIEDLHNVR